MEDNIVRLTNEYILKSEIHKLPVRQDDLERLLKNERCLVSSYGESHDIIEKLQLQPYTTRNAFLVPIPEINKTLVLYKDTLSVSARHLALAHELGHIVLRHVHCSVLEKSYFDDSAQEREAEAFARQLLAPACVLRRMGIRTVGQIASNTLLDSEQSGIIYANLRHRRKEPYQKELYKQFDCARDWSFAGVAFFGVLAFVAVGLVVWSWVAPSPATTVSSPVRNTTTYGTTSTQEEESPDQTTAATQTDTSTSTGTSTTIQNQRMVYVTVDGEKYHSEDCQHLRKNGEMKNNLRCISEEQAIKEGYTPCSVCGG